MPGWVASELITLRSRSNRRRAAGVGNVDVEHLERDPAPGGQLRGLPDDARRATADAPHELVGRRVVRLPRHGPVILRNTSRIGTGRVTRPADVRPSGGTDP